MKAKMKEKEKEFQPIELSITIESEDELRELWHRLNMSKSKVINNSDSMHPFDGNSFYPIWDLIDNKLDELNK